MASQMHHGKLLPPGHKAEENYACGLDKFKPEWIATLDDGSPAEIKGGHYIHNLSNPDMREWWIDVATNTSLGDNVAVGPIPQQRGGKTRGGREGERKREKEREEREGGGARTRAQALLQHESHLLATIATRSLLPPPSVSLSSSGYFCRQLVGCSTCVGKCGAGQGHGGGTASTP